MRHAGGICPLVVAPGAHADLRTLIGTHAPDRQIVVIADETVAMSWPDVLHGEVRLTFPAGERHKTRATWEALTDALLAAGIDRHAVIIGFGGGVTTDLAGFVAATYLRGVPWIAIPTSTLAMCDAAIGGKTGVDTPAGKNLVGAFHQPRVVVIDPELLATLPDPHYLGGLAEVVKHAAILDAGQMGWLETNVEGIRRRDAALLPPLLTTSSALKASVVNADEREAGRRAILNAGHTIAHALEQVTGYATSHGDAVSIGLVLEARIGEAMGITAPGTADRLGALLTALSLPILLPEGIDLAALVAATAHDKKRVGSDVRMALLGEIGRMHGSDDAGWTTVIPPEALQHLT